MIPASHMANPLPGHPLSRMALAARHRAECALFDVVAWVGRRLSPLARLRAGAWLGLVFWAIDARHRRIATDNVRQAYGATLDAAGAGRLAKQSMQHLARIVVETLCRTPQAGAGHELPLIAEGMEQLHAALARGKGVIVFTGHLGNWELLAINGGRSGLPVASIARPLDNPLLEQRLAAARSVHGNALINKRGAVIEAMSALRQGRLVGILIDQRPKQGGVAVPFFGRPAFTTEALAVLALRTGAAVFPGFAVLEDEQSWHVVIGQEVEIRRTGNSPADVVRVTAACTAIVEQWVRRYPEQWLWTHRRWAVPRHGVRHPASGGAHAT
jgi:Kdo2-lipid IVA lauroyltransferase/acyltransferase